MLNDIKTLITSKLASFSKLNTKTENKSKKRTLKHYENYEKKGKFFPLQRKII